MKNEGSNKIEAVRLSSKSAANYIGCANSTMKISRVTGRLLGVTAPPYRKLGRKVLYDLGALNSWLDQFGTRNNTAVSGGEE